MGVLQEGQTMSEDVKKVVDKTAVYTTSESPAGEQWLPDESERLWPNDTGTLTFDARRALVALVRGPMLTVDKKELWKALLNNQVAIRSRLADLFLELIINDGTGIAFAKNAEAADGRIPITAKSQRLTDIDTIVVLTLRKELPPDNSERVFVDKEELIQQLAPYRPIAQLDEAAFKKRIETSWSRMVRAGLLAAVETEERCEISPVLKLIFGIDEVKAREGAIADRLNGEVSSAAEDISTLDAVASEEDLFFADEHV
jgi:hypothetical protein